jgi:hypothetical protein
MIKKKKKLVLREQPTVAAMINELEGSTLKVVNGNSVVANNLKILSSDSSVTVNTGVDPDDPNALTVDLHADGGGTAGVTSVNGLTGDIGISGINPVIIGQSGDNVTVSVDTGIRSINSTGPDSAGNFGISGQDGVSVAVSGNGVVVSGPDVGVKTISSIEPDSDGNVEIAGGDNVDVSTSGNTITISATGGSSEDSIKKFHTLDGDTVPDTNGTLNLVSQNSSLRVHKAWGESAVIPNTIDISVPDGEYLQAIRINSTASGSTTTVSPDKEGNDVGFIRFKTDLISFYNPIEKNWQLLLPGTVVKSVNGVSPEVSENGTGTGAVTIDVGLKGMEVSDENPEYTHVGPNIDGEIKIVSSDDSVSVGRIPSPLSPTKPMPGVIDIKVNPNPQTSDREYNRSMCEIISEGTGYTGVKDLLTGHTAFDFPLKSKVPPEYPCPATSDVYMDLYYSSYIDQVMLAGDTSQQLQGPFYIYAKSDTADRFSLLAIYTQYVYVGSVQYLTLQCRMYKRQDGTGTVVKHKDFVVGPPDYSTYPQKATINITQEMKDSGMYPLSIIDARFADPSQLSGWANFTDWKFQPYLIIFGHIFYRYTYLI